MRSLQIKRRLKQRNNHGAYLIELLVAVAISGFLAVVLGNSLAQTMQMSAKTDHRLLSYEIAQEIIDRVRAIQFDSTDSTAVTLKSMIGTHNIRINQTTPPTDPYGIVLKPFESISTHIDSDNLSWYAGANKTPSYAFNGSAVVTISKIDDDTLNCSVTVNSPANSTSNTSTLGAVISRYGISKTHS